MPRKKDTPYPGIPKYRLTPKGRKYHELLEANFLAEQDPYIRTGFAPPWNEKEDNNVYYKKHYTKHGWTPELAEERRLWLVQQEDEDEEFNALEEPERNERTYVLVQKATLRNLLRLAGFRWLPILQTYYGFSPSGGGDQTEIVEELVDDGMIVPVKSPERDWDKELD